MLSIVLFCLIATIHAQDIVQVDCNLDAIVVRVKKGVVEAAGFTEDDIHFNDNSCTFQEGEDDFYVRELKPFTSCGTMYKVNDTHVEYLNSLSTVETGLPFPYGVVVGQPENPNVLSALISCTYNIDLRVSTMFIPNITVIDIEMPDAYGEGTFQASMALFKDDRYFEAYQTPPTMPADGTLYVGVALQGTDISEDIFLLMEDCWATVYEQPDRLPQYPLIDEGCPVAAAADGTVRVSQNGVSHQGTWQSAVFKFVGNDPEYDNVWLHCDLQLCIKDSCEPQCAARRKRRDVRSVDSDYVPNIISFGPIPFSKVSISVEPHNGVDNVYIRMNGTEQAKQPVAPAGALSPALLVTTGALAALCVICITIAVVLVCMRMKRNSRNSEMVNGGNINKAFNT